MEGRSAEVISLQNSNGHYRTLIHTYIFYARANSVHSKTESPIVNNKTQGSTFVARKEETDHLQDFWYSQKKQTR